MPELPEVETVRRGLAPVLEGATIISVELRRADLRVPFPERFAERLAGRRVERLGRRAKYLLGHLDSGEVLIVHLGMSGSFRVETSEGTAVPSEFHYERSKDAAHDHVVFVLSNGARLVFNDPRRFGLMTLVPADALASHPLFRDLGLEPLDGALDGAALAKLFAKKATPLKAALLDQRLVAGLGNIYVCEALWRAGLSPLRAAGAVAAQNEEPATHAEKLAAAIRETLEEAIAAGGSSLRDYVQASGELGLFQHRFAVYDREGASCPRPGCGGTVHRIVQSGRSTFFCPECQR